MGEQIREGTSGLLNLNFTTASSEQTPLKTGRFALETDLSHLSGKVNLDRGAFKIKLAGILQPDHVTPIEIIKIDPYIEGVDPERFKVIKKMGKAKIDHDGSPLSYMPDGLGSDFLENGGLKSKEPWGYIPDTANYLGGYVSKTFWQKHGSRDDDQSAYADSRRVPYVAMPPNYFAEGGKKGDFVFLKNRTTRKEAWAVVADLRASEGIELSVAAAKALGIEFGIRSGRMKNGEAISMKAYQGSASGKWYE